MPKKVRPIRIEGAYAFVPLTKGYEARIDVADIPLVEGRNWSACIVGKAKKRVYAVIGVKVGVGKTRLVYMHRHICGTNEPSVDHWDHDTLNNVRLNLRQCTTGQNNQNIGVRSDNSLGLKGVFPGRKGRYRVAVRLNGKTEFSGEFPKLDDAIAAYDREAVKAFGEYAYLNAQAG